MPPKKKNNISALGALAVLAGQFRRWDKTRKAGEQKPLHTAILKELKVLIAAKNEEAAAAWIAARNAAKPKQAPKVKVPFRMESPLDASAPPQPSVSEAELLRRDAERHASAPESNVLRSEFNPKTATDSQLFDAIDELRARSGMLRKQAAEIDSKLHSLLKQE